jgi:hypothetical protein
MKLVGCASVLILLGACGSVTSATDAGADIAEQPDSGPPAPTLASIDPTSGIVNPGDAVRQRLRRQSGSGTVNIGGAAYRGQLV